MGVWSDPQGQRCLCGLMRLRIRSWYRCRSCVPMKISFSDNVTGTKLRYSHPKTLRVTIPCLGPNHPQCLYQRTLHKLDDKVSKKNHACNVCHTFVARPVLHVWHGESKSSTTRNSTDNTTSSSESDGCLVFSVGPVEIQRKS